MCYVKLLPIRLIFFSLTIVFAFGCDNTLLVPEAKTHPVTVITFSTALCGGSIVNDNNVITTLQGVCWSKSQNPTIEDSKTSSKTISRNFTAQLIGLLPGTTYYVRAYLTNSDGTVYGNQVSFTTAQQLVVPILSTTPASSITTTSALLGGIVSASGGSAVTERGVCWATVTTPTVLNSKTSNGAGVGSYTINLTGLQPNKKYFARAYATNSFGTGYGNEVTFTTNSSGVITSGVLSVRVLTVTYNGGYAPDNILAIWVEDASGVFVKTILANAASRIRYLTNWVSKSNKNVVDATTGATTYSHAERTATWNATNVNRIIVPDGTYKLCMEMTESNATGKYASFTFVKGLSAVTLNPSNMPGFSTISIIWTPQ